MALLSGQTLGATALLRDLDSFQTMAGLDSLCEKHHLVKLK